MVLKILKSSGSLVAQMGGNGMHGTFPQLMSGTLHSQNRSAEQPTLVQTIFFLYFPGLHIL